VLELLVCVLITVYNYCGTQYSTEQFW